MAQDFCDCPLYRITTVTLCSGCTQQAADGIASVSYTHLTCIRLLDTYMFERVCQLLAQRHAQGLPPLPISINVSKASFEDGHYYLGESLAICQRYGIAPSLLELELHEDIPFEQREQVQIFIQKLKEAGLRCSLDDFGSARCNLHILSWIDVDLSLIHI